MSSFFREALSGLRLTKDARHTAHDTLKTGGDWHR